MKYDYDDMVVTSSMDIDSSPDFQCDETSGFPTILYVNWELGVAWLEPNINISEFDDELEECWRQCRVYGVRQCTSIEDYNQILKNLGEDAYSNAALSEEDE